MKISKKKIKEIRKIKKVINEKDQAVKEILIDFNSDAVFPEEIGLTDGNIEFATLDEFIDEFWSKAVDLILNFITSEEG